MVAAADPTLAVVEVAADLMVVVAEDLRASARPGPGSRPPRPHQQSSDASRGFKMNDPSARRSQRRLSSFDPPVPPGAEELSAAPLPLSKGWGPRRGRWEPLASASEIRIPWWGSRPPVWRTATPLSSRVGSVAKIAVLSPGSSQSVGEST